MSKVLPKTPANFNKRNMRKECLTFLRTIYGEDKDLLLLWHKTSRDAAVFSFACIIN